MRKKITSSLIGAAISITFFTLDAELVRRFGNVLVVVLGGCWHTVMLAVQFYSSGWKSPFENCETSFLLFDDPWLI